VIGFSFASVWGFFLSRDGGRFVKEIIHQSRMGGDPFDNMDWNADTTRGFGDDTTTWSDQPSDMKGMTDSLKNLETEGQ
jgi:hypothetical protein